MSKNIQSIRGMHDFAPAHAATMRVLEQTLIKVLQQYAYQEVRTPCVENLELFKRSIGEVTDIVEKEMYAFEDRGGDWLALRPEGTASTVRAGIQNGWLHNSQCRYWYLGPFFRRERPQKGRYRQFHQLGVETFGFAGPDIDVELILLSQTFWQALGLDQQKLELQINSLGDSADRAAHRTVLIEYLLEHQDSLDDEAKKRLHENPLRVLDSKNPDVQSIVADAPKLSDYLGEEAQEHFAVFKTMLDSVDISYTINPYLVRGLDYYNRTVFEWVSTELGAQSTVCAGGRYDALVGQMGGKATCAAGFAVGLERMHSLLEEQLQTRVTTIDAYFIIDNAVNADYALQLCENLRRALPTCAVQMNCGGGSIKSQMKRADRAQAKFALILGEREMQEQSISVKSLQDDRPQQMLTLEQLITLLKEETS